MTTLAGVVVLATFVALAAGKGCSPGPVDVMFVITANDSSTQAEFRYKIGIVEEFASGAKIGPDDVRVGLITEYDYPDLEFHMDDHMQNQELELAISYTYFTGGDPKFGSGLEYINQFGIDSQLGGRPGIQDVVIFLTTGIPSDITLAQTEAKKLTDGGAVVISIAMEEVNSGDLISIASGCHYVIEGSQYSGQQVLDIVGKALNLTCDANFGVPADDCKCQMIEADVMFLMDAALDQGKDNFQKQKIFAENLVEEFNIRPNETRVGAVTYSVHAHPQFGLDYHPDKFELRLALNFMPYQGEPGRHIEDGLSYIEQNSFTPASYLRKPAQKIVIITLTGPLNDPNLAQSAIMKQAELLRSKGVKIITIGIDNANLQDIQTISPDSSQHVMFKDYDELIANAKRLALDICQDDSPIPSAAPPVTSAPTPAPTTMSTVAQTTQSVQSTQAPTTQGSTTPSNPCRFNPCFNGGTCVPVGAKATCKCAPGFTGDACFNAITSAPPATNPPPTTPAPATTAAPQAQQKNLMETLGKEGCKPLEIVFLLERWWGDSEGDVDHEADMVRNLVQGWQIDDNGVRIGVLEYSGTLKEHINLADFSGNKPGLLAKLNNLRNELTDAGSANVVSAMNYAKDNMFKNPRANADKIVVAIVHDMTSQSRRDFASASQSLKAAGFTLYGLGVEMKDNEATIVKNNVDYFYQYNNFYYLEEAIDYTGFRPCS